MKYIFGVLFIMSALLFYDMKINHRMDRKFLEMEGALKKEIQNKEKCFFDKNLCNFRLLTCRDLYKNLKNE